MGHELLSSTQAYYQVGEKRRRAAVDRLANHRFDRYGNHIWRDAQALLDDEHARHALGQVSVPTAPAANPRTSKLGVAPAHSGSVASAATISTPIPPICPI